MQSQSTWHDLCDVQAKHMSRRNYLTCLSKPVDYILQFRNAFEVLRSVGLHGGQRVINYMCFGYVDLKFEFVSLY